MNSSTNFVLRIMKVFHDFDVKECSNFSCFFVMAGPGRNFKGSGGFSDVLWLRVTYFVLDRVAKSFMKTSYLSIYLLILACLILA
jgi:hypothetical protein